MKVNAKDVKEILEHLALQEASGSAALAPDHGSTICRLPVKSWQADVLRAAPDMSRALNPDELRRAMQNPDMPVIFVPATAIVTQDVLERICRENPLSKTIIWETD